MPSTLNLRGQLLGVALAILVCAIAGGCTSLLGDFTVTAGDGGVPPSDATMTPPLDAPSPDVGPPPNDGDVCTSEQYTCPRAGGGTTCVTPDETACSSCTNRCGPNQKCDVAARRCVCGAGLQLCPKGNCMPMGAPCDSPCGACPLDCRGTACRLEKNLGTISAVATDVAIANVYYSVKEASGGTPGGGVRGIHITGGMAGTILSVDYPYAMVTRGGSGGQVEFAIFIGNAASSGYRLARGDLPNGSTNTYTFASDGTQVATGFGANALGTMAYFAAGKVGAYNVYSASTNPPSGTPAPATLLVNGNSGAMVADLTFDDPTRSVFWTESDATGVGGVFRSSPGYTYPNKLVANATRPGKITVVGSNPGLVFFLYQDRGMGYVGEVDSYNPPTPMGPVAKNSNGLPPLVGLAVDGASKMAYVTDAQGAVSRLPLDAATAVPTVSMASGFTDAGPIIVAGSYVFFASADDGGSIWRLSK